jgi:hypothetical protein
VKRIYGDGLFPQHPDLFNLLKESFGVRITTTPRRSPMPINGKFDCSCNFGEVSQDQFLSSFHCVMKLAADAFYEPRLEGVKMLCDIVTKQSETLLEIPLVLEELLLILNALLLDNFDEIVQFAVVCVSLLIERVPASHVFFYDPKYQTILVTLVTLVSSGEENYYSHAHMRRYAGKAMSILLNNERLRVLIRDILKQGGYIATSWQQYTNSLQDGILSQYCQCIGECIS